MTSIAAARKASTAAKATARASAGAQLALDLAQNGIKSFDAQAKSMRASLNAELKKTPVNEATVKGLRDGIAGLEALRDAEKAKLPALREAVNASTKKHGEASAAAFTEERKLLDEKSKLERDRFDAGASASGKRTVGRAIDAGAAALDALERSLKAELRTPGLTLERKRELKKAIAALDRGEAKLHHLERQLEKSARRDDAKARNTQRKLDAFEPVSSEAQRLFTEDVTELVKSTAGSVTTHVKAAVTEAEEKANGAGTTAQLDAVLATPNRDRAMNAWQRVDRVASGSPEAKARLTPELREALVRGVALPRTSDKNGQEGILSQAQAEQAARALSQMPKERYDQVVRLLAAAGGTTGDAQTERALILKAVAARADRLTEEPGKATGPYAFIALTSIKSFANEIRGEQKDVLIRSTSPIDLNAAVNESTVDPSWLRWQGNDSTANNDGRFQKFESTCAPTTAQIVNEEADPIAARRMSKSPVSDADPSTAAAQQQREVLGSSDSSTSSRRAQQAHDVAMAWGKKLKMSGLELALLDGELRGRPFPAWWGDGKALLKQVQAADGGMPGTTELGWMKKELASSNEGMNMQRALGDVVGRDYQQLELGGTVTATWTDAKNKTQTTKMKVPDGADFAVWDSRLKEGLDIPLRITDGKDHGGHAITITDVRGQPNSEYLIADPWTGRAAWVSQTEIAQGLDAKGIGWIDRHFPGLGWDRIGAYFVEKD